MKAIDGKRLFTEVEVVAALSAVIQAERKAARARLIRVATTAEYEQRAHERMDDTR